MKFFFPNSFFKKMSYIPTISGEVAVFSSTNRNPNIVNSVLDPWSMQRMQLEPNTDQEIETCTLTRVSVILIHVPTESHKEI